MSINPEKNQERFNVEKHVFHPIRKFSFKYRKLIIIAFIIWGFFAFGLGNIIGGFLISKASLGKFPDIVKDDRILILAPHIDDEIISSAGIIQQAKSVGAQVKIVYMTNGDDNIYSIVGENKNLKVTPDEFVTLGEQRMKEGEAATQILGLTSNDLIFLGFPDAGLMQMLSKFYNTPFTARGTRLTYNPYQGTYKQGQSYTGVNVSSDLNEIITSFNPTIIIVSHQRDKNTDHVATYRFLEKYLVESGCKGRVFAYLTHYNMYPSEQKLKMNDFLYPPKRLFSQKGWVSFDLTQEQENKKLEAVNQNKSQLEFSKIKDLLRSFVKRNEIFEEIDQ